MSYLCEICGTAFDEPTIIERNENIAGFWVPYRAAVCPICGTPYFVKAEECSCGGVRIAGDRLCKECRGNLLKRITGFFDELTVEEEEQFDDWMDGESIANRKRWS